MSSKPVAKRQAKNLTISVTIPFAAEALLSKTQIRLVMYAKETASIQAIQLLPIVGI